MGTLVVLYKYLFGEPAISYMNTKRRADELKNFQKQGSVLLEHA